MDVLIPLATLTGALARSHPRLVPDAAIEAYLEDLTRDRLLLSGPCPRLGYDVRVPPPPRDTAFRRLLVLAAAMIADPEVAPAARLALAASGPRPAATHPIRRLAAVAEALAPSLDPRALLDDRAQAEELARRVAAAFQLTVS